MILRCRLDSVLFVLSLSICGLAVAHPPTLTYASPEELTLSKDGTQLFVSCSGSDEVVVVDRAKGTLIKRIRVGRKPRGIQVDPVSGMLYVANSWEDTVSEIDPQQQQIVRVFGTGREPVGLALDASLRRLFTMNRLSGDLSVIDLTTGKVFATIPVGRGVSYGAIFKKRLFASRIYPNVRAIREVPENEIVEVDTGTLQIVKRISLPGIGAMFRLAMSNDGSVGIAAALRPKNLIPTAQVAHGGVFGNSLVVFGDVPGNAAMMPLDALEDSLAQPFDVKVTSRPLRVYVSASGADEIAVLDGQRLLDTVAKNQTAAHRLAVDNLALARLYTVKRIDVGRNPKGMALLESAKRLYVANRLDDTISVIDTARDAVISVIRVGESERLTPERRGEQHLNSARFSYARQFSCASCHVDYLSDGLSWDLAQDGFGLDVVLTKPLEGLSQTAPYKWDGSTPDLETECGPLSERYFFRSQGFRKQELADVSAFLKSISTRPNRDKPPGGALTSQQARGKAIFDRKVTKDGRHILHVLQCPACHSGPAFTTNQSFSVGTRMPADRVGSFDTPMLISVGYNTAFLHDGSAKTLKELWTRFNQQDLHGFTGDLASEELDDLVEYLKTL